MKKEEAQKIIVTTIQQFCSPKIQFFTKEASTLTQSIISLES